MYIQKYPKTVVLEPQVQGYEDMDTLEGHRLALPVSFYLTT